MTKSQLLAQRFYNQGLVIPYDNVEDLLRESLGIQAQYLNHGLFNIATRLDWAKDQRASASLDQAILAWGQRQTYHFYDLETWQMMSHFLADERLWVDKHFQAQDLDLDAAVAELEDKLQEDKKRSVLSAEYGQRWKSLFEWSALFLYTSRQGKLYHKLLADDRLVKWQDRQNQPSNDLPKHLLEAYFTFYGPASLADAAHFFGVTQAKIEPIDVTELKTYQVDDRLYYAKLWHDEATIPQVLVLGKFDPLLVSYKHKAILIGQDDQPHIWGKAGQIAAIILIKGKLRATWTMATSGKTISFTVTANKEITQRHQATIRRIFRRYTKWVDKEVRAITFNIRNDD